MPDPKETSLKVPDAMVIQPTWDYFSHKSMANFFLLIWRKQLPSSAIYLLSQGLSDRKENCFAILDIIAIQPIKDKFFL